MFSPKAKPAKEFNAADQQARASALRGIGQAAGTPCPECGGRTRQGVCTRCGHSTTNDRNGDGM